MLHETHYKLYFHKFLARLLLLTCCHTFMDCPYLFTCSKLNFSNISVAGCWNESCVLYWKCKLPFKTCEFLKKMFDRQVVSETISPFIVKLILMSNIVDESTVIYYTSHACFYSFFITVVAHGSSWNLSYIFYEVCNALVQKPCVRFFMFYNEGLTAQTSNILTRISLLCSLSIRLIR